VRLVNKTVLITGGNSGISLTTARVFLEEAREAIARADTSSNGKVLFTPGTCWRPPES